MINWRKYIAPIAGLIGLILAFLTTFKKGERAGRDAAENKRRKETIRQLELEKQAIIEKNLSDDEIEAHNRRIDDDQLFDGLREYATENRDSV